VLGYWAKKWDPPTKFQPTPDNSDTELGLLAFCTVYGPMTSHWPTLEPFVASTLDYCNALLCSVPAATFDTLPAPRPKQSSQSRSVLRMNSLHTWWQWPSLSYGQTSSIQKLQQCQRVKDSAAWIVLQAPRRSHSTSLLRQLHWLTAQQRIIYKLAVQTFKVRTTSMPTYLSHHIITCDSVRRAVSTLDNEYTAVWAVRSYGLRQARFPLFGSKHLEHFAKNC